MPASTATKIIIATTKDLTVSLKQTNKNHLLPPSDTITHKLLFQIDSIFSNASSSMKSQQSPTFRLPRVSTSKTFAAPPRASPYTTQYFHSISPTTQKHRRDIQAVKSKTSLKYHCFSLLPKFKSNPRPRILSLDNTDAYFTKMNLPAKLQHLVQQEINRTSNPSINPLLKINAVLDATTRKVLEYKQLTKGQDKKTGSMAAQKNFQDSHKEAKKIIPKEPTRCFLFVQVNYQGIRNRPTFASVQIFDHKKNICAVYNSPSAEI